MNEREKFLFDLQGFLVVKNLLTQEEVDALNAAVDANFDKRGEDGNSHTGDSKTLVGTHKRGMFSGMLTWQKPWCQPFRDILAHPKSIPYLNTIHGRGWRLDHSPFILTSDLMSEGLILHGSSNHHFDGSQYYVYRNGQMRCGMVVFQYQLHDVNEGDGGLCVIPGRHKANLRCPKEIRESFITSLAKQAISSFLTKRPFMARCPGRTENVNAGRCLFATRQSIYISQVVIINRNSRSGLTN